MKMMESRRCSTRREHWKRKFQVPGVQGPGSLGNHRKGPDERRSDLQAVCGRVPAHCSDDVWRTTQFAVSNRGSLARACAGGRASGRSSRARKGPLSRRSETKSCSERCNKMKDRQDLAVRRPEECEREAARPANASWREPWLDLARQWRELAAEVKPRGDGNKS
jgi:hypothetical protein